MKLDDVLEAWRSQDEAPFYSVNSEQLQQALGQEQATMQRQLLWEARFIYGASAVLLAGLAFIFAIMVYDDDPRTTWDFVIVILGAAAFVLWASALYVGRKTQALRERRFSGSLRDEIGLHIALLDYQMGRFWRPGGILLTMLPLFFGVVALWLSIGRINNLPIDAWQAIWSFLPMAAILVFGFWIARRMAEQETLPRKRRLEALLEELDAS